MRVGIKYSYSHLLHTITVFIFAVGLESMLARTVLCTWTLVLLQRNEQRHKSSK